MCVLIVKYSQTTIATLEENQQKCPHENEWIYQICKTCDLLFIIVHMIHTESVTRISYDAKIFTLSLLEITFPQTLRKS